MVRGTSLTNLPGRQYWSAIFTFLLWRGSKVADTVSAYYQCLKDRSGLLWSPPPAPRAWQAFREGRMSEWTATDSRWHLAVSFLVSSPPLLYLSLAKVLTLTLSAQIYYVRIFFRLKNITIWQLNIRQLQIQRIKDSTFIQLRKLSSAQMPKPWPFPSQNSFFPAEDLYFLALLYLCHRLGSAELSADIQATATVGFPGSTPTKWQSPPSLQTLQKSFFF